MIELNRIKNQAITEDEEINNKYKTYRTRDEIISNLICRLNHFYFIEREESGTLFKRFNKSRSSVLINSGYQLIQVDDLEREEG